jgi:ATP-dependent DNA helicase RecG
MQNIDTKRFLITSTSTVAGKTYVARALASGLRQMLDTPIGAQVETLVMDAGGEEGVMLRVYIPEAVPDQKPIYIRSPELDKGCYKHVGWHDMPCTENDLARFFQDRALISQDMLPVPLALRAELNMRSIKNQFPITSSHEQSAGN